MNGHLPGWAVCCFHLAASCNMFETNPTTNQAPTLWNQYICGRCLSFPYRPQCPNVTIVVVQYGTSIDPLWQDNRIIDRVVVIVIVIVIVIVHDCG